MKHIYLALKILIAFKASMHMQPGAYYVFFYSLHISE